MRQLRIKKLLHATFLVADLRLALEFYCGILGFKPSDKRPKMQYPGVWFEFGSQQLHLMELPNPDPISGRPQHPGRDRHVAFAVTDLEILAEHLSQHDVSFNISRSGRRAIFLRDPDGNGLEFVEQSRAAAGREAQKNDAESSATAGNASTADSRPEAKRPE